MDIFAGPSPDNFDEVRDRSCSTKGNISRDSSMFSIKSSIVYHKKIEHNNAMVIDDEMNDIFPALSYETDQEKVLRISKVAEQQINMRFKCSNLVPSKLTPQYIINEQQHSDPTYGQATHIKDDMVINIQLLYDSHAPMEPDL